MLTRPVKARENRDAYENGWKTMKAELTDSEVKQIFGSNQASPSEIWEELPVDRLWQVADRSRSLARYFLAVSMALERMDGGFEERIESARGACHERGVP